MNKYFFYLIVLLTTTITFAQNNTEKCFSDILHQRRLDNDSKYKALFENFNQIVANIPRGQKAGGTIYRVPIVIHVMHKGEAVGTGTNISDLDIQNGVRLINQLYRKEAGSKGDGNGVDVELEFALAVRDPNGNCTDGIVRYDMSGNALYMSDGVLADVSGITEGSLKALSVWDQTKYYNIWLVSEIDNNEGGYGIQGYAYYSTSHGGALDGAIFLSQKFAIEGNTTATHELGHAMNLAHTFNGDNNGGSCPANTSCTTQGDYICDTPPHIRSGSDCVTGTNGCDGNSSRDLFIHNYMDYSSDACQSEFTAGQKTRAQTALTTHRASFLESNGNMSLVPPSLASADFRSSSSGGCTGSIVKFYDESSCTPNTYQNGSWTGITFAWTFDNGVDAPITSTLQNPEITFTNAGEYGVTLAVTNSFGTNTITKNSFIIITSSPIAPTCTGSSTYSGTLSYGIYNVVLNTLNHSSGGTYDDNTSGVTTSGYGDFSCDDNTILLPNTTYTIYVEGTSNSGITENVVAYIDYNNDGDFEDVGEEIATWNAIVGNSGLIGRSFTTPATPNLNTLLRMRVISERGDGSGVVIYPCPGVTPSSSALLRGQIHDFGVYFRNNTTNPEISFNSATTSASETFTPDGNNDCRPYKDYTITMDIGSAPTGDAIVTPIIDSSYADSLYDFVILNTPLTFTDGATASRSFTIRVYDDAVIENIENIYLSFNISGTTDAVKGGGSPTHTFSITNNDVTPTGSTVTIWTEDFETGSQYTYPSGWTVIHTTGGTNNNWIVDNGSCSGHNINNASMIILDNDPDGGNGPYCGYWNYNAPPIYFYKQVDATSLYSVTVDFNWKGLGEAGGDYGELIYATNPAGPWTSLATYFGQSNTQLASESLPSSLDNSIFYIGWRFTYNTNSTINNSPSFSIDDIIVKGNTKVNIETNISTSNDNQYLGPNQSIYFYDQTDGDLILKIDNTSNHDYGCTTVEVDRAGTSTVAFQTNTVAYNVTDKSYKIIPTTNNLTGTYDVTLYYSESEIAGWESSTARSRNDMEIVKTSTTISSVTPSTPKISETFYTSNSTMGAFGTDVWIKGSYTNGFSGFAAGIDANISLELEYLDFSGVLENKNVLLNWFCDEKLSLNYFEVQRSKDQKIFETIGMVKHSNETNNYSFIDKSPFFGLNYYRLKLNSNTNSKTISVNIHNALDDISVSPVPFGNELIINFNSFNGTIKYNILDILGRNVNDGEIEANGDNNQIVLNTSLLPKGTYFITFKNENKYITKKIIK